MERAGGVTTVVSSVLSSRKKSPEGCRGPEFNRHLAFVFRNKNPIYTSKGGGIYKNRADREPLFTPARRQVLLHTAASGSKVQVHPGARAGQRGAWMQEADFPLGV